MPFKSKKLPPMPARENEHTHGRSTRSRQAIHQNTQSVNTRQVVTFT